MNSGGFTINWDVNGNHATKYICLCLAGPSIQVGNYAKTTAAATTTDTKTVPNVATISGLLTLTNSAAASASVANTWRWMMGAADGTHGGSAGANSKGGISTLSSSAILQAFVALTLMRLQGVLMLLTR